MTDLYNITTYIDAPSLGVIQEAIRKLTKDERAAAITLGKDEARFLVDAYYCVRCPKTVSRILSCNGWRI